MRFLFRFFDSSAHSSGSFTLILVAGTLLLNLLVLGLAAMAIHADKLEHEARARITSQNVSSLLEHDVAAVFDRIDLALLNTVDEIGDLNAAGRTSPEHLNEFLRRQQSRLTDGVSLQVTDAKGVIRYGSGTGGGDPVDLSDQDDFKMQRDNAHAGLVIARPVKAQTDQGWSIPVSRRLNRPNGEFGGIVSVKLPVAYFVDNFSKVKLGPQGLVSLRSAEHLSMARYPVAQTGGGAVGEFALSDQLRNLLKSHPASVSYVAHSPADGIERTSSYTKVAAYPLYIIVGLATDDYLSEWRRDAAQTSATVLMIVLMSSVFTGMLIRSWRRQMRVDDTLRESEERWSMALESGNFVVWDWNLQSGEVQLSKAGKQLFGFADDEIGNQMSDWMARCHREDLAHVEAALKDHVRARTARFFVDYRVQCKDGSWKWILTRGLVMRRAADGKPLRMIGTHSDISARREREDSLRLAATMFEIADEAVVVTDSRNRIISVNPAFSAITGYAAEEVIGRNPSLLSAKTLPKSFYMDMWKTLIESGSWRGEVLNRKKSGVNYVQWLSIKRLLDDKGQVTHHVAVFSDVSQSKITEERMRYLALHDALTGLPNRVLLGDRLHHAIDMAKRDQTSLALLYFDLDKFKPVNDMHGHEVGDQLLKEVSARVKACVRESDTVARIGGDEFVALLPKLHEASDAMRIAEKIRHALSQPFDLAGQVCEISASIGVAIYPEHGGDEQRLTHSADTAMYHAKQHGRNQVKLYEPGMQED